MALDDSRTDYPTIYHAHCQGLPQKGRGLKCEVKKENDFLIFVVRSFTEKSGCNVLCNLKKDANKVNCEKKNFYSLPEFNKWYREVPNPQAYQIDYYKGLGTSDAQEFKEYFVDITRHKIPFRYSGTECDDRIKLAFAKERVDDRKTWLSEYMQV